MSTKKLLATGLLTFVMVTQLSLAAFAEDEEDDDVVFTPPTSRPVGPTLRPLPPREKRHHNNPEFEENFKISVPPVVITPDDEDDEVFVGPNQKATGAGVGKPTFRVSPPNGVAGVAPNTDGHESVVEPKTSAFDPEANAPIEVSKIQITKKTPADVFIESAQIGIGAMAAGAAVLGVTAAVRGVRFRRQAKTDFIYEVEN